MSEEFSQSSETENYCWMLHEIAKSLGEARNLPATLNLITRSAVDSLNIKAAAIRLLSYNKNMLELAGVYGLSDEYLKKGPVELNKSPIDQEAILGEPITVEDVEREDRLQYPDEAKKEGIKSLICIPLKVRDNVIGSLRAYTSTLHKFKKAEIIFLTALANLGAIAIENTQLTENLRLHAETMRELLEISKSISSTLNSEEIFNRIVKSAVKNLKAEGGLLRLINSKDQKLEIVSSTGLSEKYLAKKIIPFSDEIQNILNGEVTQIYDATTDKRITRCEDIQREGFHSILAAPITVKGKIIGVLKVYTKDYRVFNKNDVEFITLLASFGGIALGNARLYKMALTNWQNLLKDVWGKLDVWGPPEL